MDIINLYLVDYFTQNTNGLTTYRDQLFKILLHNNHIQPHYIWVNCKKYAVPKKELDSRGVAHFYFPTDLNSRFDTEHNQNTIINFLQNEIAGEKNIIFHFNWINHSPFAYILKRHIHCKTLLTKHCIPWRDFIIKNYSVFYLLNKRLNDKSEHTHIHPSLTREKLSYEAVDHIICVTEFAKIAIKKLLHVPSDKLSLVYNGLGFVKKRGAQHNKAFLKKKFGFGVQEKIILFVGKLHESKGINDLVVVFNHLIQKLNIQACSLRLVVAGVGNYDGLLTRASNVWSKITFTGPLEKRYIYDFYQMADVGIVPSYIEQCSYTAIEMMHFGLPIIVADVDGLSEIIPNKCGLKIPLVLGKKGAYLDKKKLREAILFFLKNPKTAQRFSINAKRHAQENFTARKMAFNTIEVYKKLIVGDNKKNNRSEYTNTEKQPLVSVILPCFNAEAYLKECIDSILRQTYSNFELVIINDASTDNTVKILQTYKDDRIRFITNKLNYGIAYSLNRGIGLANGKYLARIDADDIMHEERLLKQCLFLEEEKNNDVAVVGSYHIVIDTLGKMVGLKQYPLLNNEIKITMLFQNPFSHPSVMIRSTALKRIRYNKKYMHAEDYYLWFRLSNKYKFANLPEFLTYYRIHNANVSHKNINEQQKNAINLISNELDKLGIDFSSSELALHIAINSGYGTKYFNNSQKITDLRNWLGKVLSVLQKKYAYSKKEIQISETDILQTFCGIYN